MDTLTDTAVDATQTDVVADAPPPAAPSMTDAYKDEAPAPIEEPQPDAEDEANPETDDTDADADADADAEADDQPDEPAPEPVAAPNSWSKDAKEVFTKLEALGPEGRALAETIAQREADREKFVQIKSREAATTRQAVETEAMTALQTIMRNQAQALEQFLPPVPEMPNPQLLNTGDPQHRELYYSQKAQYDYANAQRDQIAQQVEQARQQADLITQQQLQTELQSEHGLLAEQFGDEWSEPSSRAKLLSDLEPIAAELGYPKEAMAQARAADIIALRRIGEIKSERDQLRVKADKYDQLMKRKMQPVRAAKQQLPPAARPGAQAGLSKPVGTLAALYPNDLPRN